MSNIFFDLDGTIINSQRRLYDLFCELCPENRFSYDEYWEIKRNRINQSDFLKKYFNYDDNKISLFRKNYLDKIEDDYRIFTDSPVVGISEILKKLSKNYNLYIITNRQNDEITQKQIKDFGWDIYFKKILNTAQKIRKSELIRQKISISVKDVFISDVGEDINEAKLLGVYSVAVSWGIQNTEILSSYNPDALFDKVEDFYSCSFINISKGENSEGF